MTLSSPNVARVTNWRLPMEGLQITCMAASVTRAARRTCSWMLHTTTVLFVNTISAGNAFTSRLKSLHLSTISPFISARWPRHQRTATLLGPVALLKTGYARGTCLHKRPRTQPSQSKAGDAIPATSTSASTAASNGTPGNPSKNLGHRSMRNTCLSGLKRKK